MWPKMFWPTLWMTLSVLIFVRPHLFCLLSSVCAYHLRISSIPITHGTPGVLMSNAKLLNESHDGVSIRHCHANFAAIVDVSESRNAQASL